MLGHMILQRKSHHYPSSYSWPSYSRLVISLFISCRDCRVLQHLISIKNQCRLILIISCLGQSVEDTSPGWTRTRCLEKWISSVMSARAVGMSGSGVSRKKLLVQSIIELHGKWCRNYIKVRKILTLSLCSPLVMLLTKWQVVWRNVGTQRKVGYNDDTISSYLEYVVSCPRWKHSRFCYKPSLKLFSDLEFDQLMWGLPLKMSVSDWQVITAQNSPTCD